MNDQQKTPMPGEWWETRGTKYKRPQRVLIVALVNAPHEPGLMELIVYSEYAEAKTYLPDGRWSRTARSQFDLTRHLPGCTGWDWEEKKDD